MQGSPCLNLQTRMMILRTCWVYLAESVCRWASCLGGGVGSKGGSERGGDRAGGERGAVLEASIPPLTCGKSKEPNCFSRCALMERLDCRLDSTSRGEHSVSPPSDPDWRAWVQSGTAPTPRRLELTQYPRGTQTSSIAFCCLQKVRSFHHMLLGKTCDVWQTDFYQLPIYRLYK